MLSVSVIIPVFNERSERLEPSIHSALLAGADEVVVIDDGSAACPATGHSPLVSVYRQPHAGISAALNHGRRRASGDLLCWLSAGDLMDHDKIRRQRRAMLASAAGACFHDYRNGVRDVTTSRDWASRLWYDNQFCLSTMMIRADVWDRVGGFDESLQWCVDWDFACRVQARGGGWRYLAQNLGFAAEFDDGHTARAMADERLRAARYADRATVSRRWRGPIR